MKPLPRQLTAWCFMLLSLTVAWVAYAPGLHGAFLFDDAANLPALGASGPVDNAPTLLRYLTSGRADPTGRPLSLASFLVDAHDWPASPYPFKRTNLLLHLLNGALLFLTLRGIGLAMKFERRRADAAGVISASIWLLHPFFVSTVLYIVQREAMLPATFALLGIVCSLKSRSAYLEQRRLIGISWLTGIGICTLLAFLCKANGILVPLLVLVIHAVLPADQSLSGAAHQRALRIALVPIATITVAYPLWIALVSIGAPPIPIRGWSVTQRLLTEPTILLDYLAQLWLLKPIDSSLMHDDIKVATSLISPWYTGVAVLTWAVIGTVTWRQRRRHPSLTLAVIFFLCGHLLESSSLALELYFDHRNYLPAMMMFWPVGIVLTRWKSTVPLVGGVAIAVLLAALTYANASLWGRPLDLAVSWARAYPESARAQAYAAQMESAEGLWTQARRRIDAAEERFTDEPQIALNLLDIHCVIGGVTTSDLTYANEALANAEREPGPLLLNWFATAVELARHGSCPGLDREALSHLLDAAQANPKIAAIPGRRQDILHARGLLALAWGEPDDALQLFDRALAEAPTPETALRQAASLASAGFPSQGSSHLEYFSTLAPVRVHTWRDGMPWIHDMVLERQRYWQTEIEHLQDALSSNARKGDI